MRPIDGDMVVIHHKIDEASAPFIELSLKRYCLCWDGPLLVSESDDPDFQETLRLDPSILISGVVIRVDRPTR
jgi:hypothetical protein